MVERLWPGSTVVCIASGPSLTVEDVNAVRGKARVIVVNNTYKLAPWADALHAHDSWWWTAHKGVPSFQGLKFGVQRVSCPGVTVLKDMGATGLSLDPTGVKTGLNSGYQAIGVAFHLGAARILLLGYDMQLGPNGARHWHADHKNTMGSAYAKFVECFTTIAKPLRAAGVQVINCSRSTALTCFPRMPLAEALSLQAIQQAVAS